jgi:hypothetical protein
MVDLRWIGDETSTPPRRRHVTGHRLVEATTGRESGRL